MTRVLVTGADGNISYLNTADDSRRLKAMGERALRGADQYLNCGRLVQRTWRFSETSLV